VEDLVLRQRTEGARAGVGSPPAEPHRLVRKEYGMLPPDSEISRQLARERQAELKRDWQSPTPASPHAVESRRRRWRFRVEWLRAHLRPQATLRDAR
jgi:hypothetical protein